MVITLAQYIADAKNRDRDVTSLETCLSCGTPLQETINGYRQVEGGTHCSDCDFKDISALVDDYSIRRPMSVCAAAL